jgi:FtsH-binding integral membrane protein
MMNENVTSPRAISAEQAEELVRAFIIKVYGWMSAGLMVTGILAFATIQSESMLQFVFGNRLVFYGLIIAQLGLVIWLSARIQAMSAMTATMVFMAYSALTGVTLSAVFLLYTAASLASTFFITAATFGVMTVYGLTTKRDLTNIGSFLMMGLIGMIIASLVNMFLQNEMVYWISTYIGIVIFVGLTAFDTQKIKALAPLSIEGSEEEQKGAIIGALRLYLDFINLFLLLLRVMGKRR